MPDAKRILISGYYGYANAGDEAILAVLVSQLRARLTGVAITVISGRPEETAATHQVEALLWSDPEAIALAVQQSDLVITGGGGIFHDYGGFSTEGLLSEGNWGLGFHVTAGLLAGLFGKPHVLYAIGVGPLFAPQGRDFVRAICDGATAITVRDEASAALLKSLGVERVEVTADPAFLLTPAAIPTPAERIGVVIRHWTHEVALDVWERELAAGLDAFLQNHPTVQVVFLPFQQWQGEQEDDIAASERVLEKMAYRDRATLHRQPASPQQKAAILAGCRLVVAMRLHALIFAANAGVPFVALTYDEKVRQLGARLQYDSALDMAQLTGSALVDKMEAALGNPPPDTALLASLAQRNIEIAAGALGHGSLTLSGQTLSLLQRAVLDQLAEQKRLRHWLRDQQMNYEFQIGQQQQELDRLRPFPAQYDAEQQRREQLEQTLSQTTAALTQERDSLAAQLATVEQARSACELQNQDLLQQLAALTAQHHALTAQHATLTQLHKDTTNDWEQYASQMQERLGVYRSQRAWRGMLALRKAYTISRGGFTAKLRLIPFAFQLLFGNPNLESEQLEFPPRPRPGNR